MIIDIDTENNPFNEPGSSNFRIKLSDIQTTSVKSTQQAMMPQATSSAAIDKKKLLNLHPTRREGLITVIPVEEHVNVKSIGQTRRLKQPINVSAPSTSSIQEQLSNHLASLRPNLSIDLKSMDMPEELINRMFEHQREGVAWLHHLHENHGGGILGDG